MSVENITEYCLLGKIENNELIVIGNDISSLELATLNNKNTHNLQNVSYNKSSGKYEPFLLDVNIKKIEILKKDKRILLHLKDKLKRLEVDKFIDDICRQIGNRKLIEQRIVKFWDILAKENNKEMSLKGDLCDFVEEDNVKTTQKVDEYKTYLKVILPGSSLIRHLVKVLMDSKISLNKVKENKFLIKTLYNMFEEFSTSSTDGFKLINCTPIYHSPNIAIKPNSIEVLLNHFINHNQERTIELLAQIFKLFYELIESNNELLCGKKVINFLHYFKKALLELKIDFKQHEQVLKTLRIYMNYFQTTFDLTKSILSDELKCQFTELDFIVQLREGQSYK